MNALTKILFRLLESYIVVMIIALVIGIAWPAQVVVLAPYTTLLLQGIFFLASLKIDLAEVRRHLRQPIRIVLANLFMLGVFPLLAYPLTRAFFPEAAVGITLLALMPTAMTVPLFASLAGGSEALSLVLTVTTSLLAPFTVPLVAKLALGSAVVVDAAGMFWNLASVIFLPFVLAQLVRRGLKAQVRAASFTFKSASILLLGLLIAAVVAKNAAALRASIGAAALPILIALFLFFAVTHFVGYLTAFHRTHAEQVTYALALAYMNFVTAIYLAEKFFPDPGTILTTVLAVIPWTLLFIPFRAWAVRKN